MQRGSDLIESMAIAGAIACLAHCVALPILMALLPTIAAIVPVPETVHLAALIFAAPTTLFSLVMGYRRHDEEVPLMLGVSGLLLLGIGVLHFPETKLEVVFTVAGSLALAAAHVANWRERRTAFAA